MTVLAQLSVNTIGFGTCPIRAVLAELAEHDLTVLGVPMVQVETGGLEANLSALRRGGCTVVSTVVPQAFTLADPSRWDGERDRLRAGLDVAAELGDLTQNWPLPV